MRTLECAEIVLEGCLEGGNHIGYASAALDYYYLKKREKGVSLKKLFEKFQDKWGDYPEIIKQLRDLMRL